MITRLISPKCYPDMFPIKLIRSALVKDKTFIQEFIQKELIRGKNISDLDVTDNLIESGVIDSLGIQLLVSYLEKNFSISIADADLIPENFETVDAIWSFLNKGEKITIS